MPLAALLERWNAVPRSVRLAVAAIAVTSGFFIMLAVVLTHPQRVPLFSASLHPEQVSEVEERLASWNVAFTPVADNVVVEAKRRSDLLLKLSLAGVPHGHIEDSSDVLGRVGALTPQAVIDAQTRDGLAGDIELGLRGISGIQDARVIIAPAKQGFFADETSRDASASVRLRMIPGARLSADAVAGIRSFVSASVAGLESRRVTIVDDRGVELGEASGGEDATDLQRSLQSALDAAIGAGASIVRVHMDYDRRAIESTSTRRSPAGAQPIGTNSQRERYSGDGKRYERTDEQIDRGSETRQVTTSWPGGRVARITAAVFVDATRAVDIYQVRALSAATLGIDPRRGDALEVATIAFARAAVPRKDGWWLAYGVLVPLLPTLVTIVAMLVALSWGARPAAALVRTLTERARIARSSAAVAGIAPAKVRGVLADEPPHAAAAIISALPASTAAAVLDMYPPEERAAIVRRMQRAVSPLLPDVETFIAKA